MLTHRGSGPVGGWLIHTPRPATCPPIWVEGSPAHNKPLRLGWGPGPLATCLPPTGQAPREPLSSWGPFSSGPLRPGPCLSDRTVGTRLWVTLCPCADHHRPGSRPPPPGPGAPASPAPLSSAAAWKTELSLLMPPEGLADSRPQPPCCPGKTGCPLEEATSSGPIPPL